MHCTAVQCSTVLQYCTAVHCPTAHLRWMTSERLQWENDALAGQCNKCTEVTEHSTPPNSVHWTAMHSIALHCTTLYCNTLHCIALPYTALPCKLNILPNALHWTLCTIHRSHYYHSITMPLLCHYYVTTMPVPATQSDCQSAYMHSPNSDPIVTCHRLSMDCHWNSLHYSALQCTTMHYSALQCTTVHYSALQCTTMHYSEVQCSATPHISEQCWPGAELCGVTGGNRSLLHYTTLHYRLHYLPTDQATLLHCTQLYYTAMHCIVLYWNVLYCTKLYCTVLYCTALYCPGLFWTALHWTVIYCTVTNCIVLGWTELGLIVPHCTAHNCTYLLCFFAELYITVL